MGSTNAKCDICNVKISKSQLICHLRVCKAQDILKKTCKTCDKCKLSIPINEYEDHLVCHRLEDASNNNQQQVMINYISNRNTIANQNNYFSNPVVSQPDNLNTIIRTNSHSIASNNNVQRNDDIRRTTIIATIPSIRQRRPTSTSNNNIVINNTNRQNIFLEDNEGNFNIRNIHTLRNLLRNLSESLNEMRSGNRNEGVSSDILSLMPESILTDVTKFPEEKRNCVICMSQFDKGDKIITILCCHLYHSECILNWFKTKNTCPICKFKIDKNGLGL